MRGKYSSTTSRVETVDGASHWRVHAVRVCVRSPFRLVKQLRCRKALSPLTTIKTSPPFLVTLTPTPTPTPP
ncbi:hypothetical protein ANANG_G00236680 [Anguilla anguilla]|uniref:Uncharacterized protein n=1 Tax=Anguilla anguilla TaxID=7936 RepID=A0A9D3RRN2_ANGAN|nr:hypothetical protein ANANG_G00236680 [Anguilla anguilla]